MGFRRALVVSVLVAIVAMEILRPLWTWLGWSESWLVVVAVVIATQAWPAVWERRKRP